MNDDEIKALCDAATPGPWGMRTPNQLRQLVAGQGFGDRPSWGDLVASVDDDYSGDSTLREPDACFIAAARTLVPALLERARKAEGEVAALKGGAGRAGGAP